MMNFNEEFLNNNLKTPLTYWCIQVYRTWSMLRADVNTCSSMICMNGGQCQSDPHLGSVCRCTRDFSGRYCTTRRTTGRWPRSKTLKWINSARSKSFRWSGSWVDKTPSCHREAARCFVSLNISPSHSRSLNAIENVTIQKLVYGFLFAISHSIVAMALFCIISEIKRDVGRKTQFFIYPAFHAPVRRSPSKYCHKFWYRKTRMLCTRWLKSLWIRLLLSTQYTNVTDRRTYRRTDTAQQHMSRLCIMHSIAWQQDVYESVSFVHAIDTQLFNVHSKTNSHPA